MNLFKNIYATYFVLSVGLVVGYSLLDRLFIQHLGIVEPKREIVTFWIPVGLSMLFGFTILRRRMKPLPKAEECFCWRSLLTYIVVLAINYWRADVDATRGCVLRTRRRNFGIQKQHNTKGT